MSTPRTPAPPDGPPAFVHASGYAEQVEQAVPLTDRAQLLVDCLDLPAATGVDNAVWERFQLAHLNDQGTFRIETKSRQVAWSWTISAEATADAILDGQSSAFVSINEDEAQEKIRYARSVYDNLHTPFRKPALVRDSLTTLEFQNGARLLSQPARAVRGKARFNIYFDEFAHIPKDRQVYTGSLPAMTRGGRVRAGSSPFGGSGTHWEIATESLQPYPRYTRSWTPWWLSAALCRDVPVAAVYAPRMSTRERVQDFGSDVLQAIFESLAVEDFQQEYECAFMDEASAWIPWDEIRDVQTPGLVCPTAETTGSATADARLAIALLEGMVRRGEVERHMAAGFDVGRTRNASELVLVGVGTATQTPVRLMITLNACPFPEQYDVLAFALARLPIQQLLVDRNGIGRQLAEDLEANHPNVAIGVDFTNPSKVEWATRLKVGVQQRRVLIPVHRDLAYQLHSVKRVTSSTSRALTFDVSRNEKHHADKFWALALAVSALPRATAADGSSGGFGMHDYLAPQDRARSGM